VQGLLVLKASCRAGKLKHPGNIGACHEMSSINADARAG
jgi:hypothetical protein